MRWRRIALIPVPVCGRSCRMCAGGITWWWRRQTHKVMLRRLRSWHGWRRRHVAHVGLARRHALRRRRRGRRDMLSRSVWSMHRRCIIVRARSIRLRALSRTRRVRRVDRGERRVEVAAGYAQGQRRPDLREEACSRSKILRRLCSVVLVARMRYG